MRKLVCLAVALATVVAGLVTGAGAADATVSHTRKIVIRPVHADGRPVHGYTVSHESIPGFTCLDTSPVAVDKNIRYCGFSATYTVACWKSKNHTVLCLRDPWQKKLVRIRYSGRFRPTAAPKHPVPQALRLGSGNRCWIRDGGAWSWVNGYPNWYGAYGCEFGDVYGPGDGINQSRQPWRVHLVVNAGMANQRIYRFAVARAFFVGTAA